MTHDSPRSARCPRRLPARAALVLAVLLPMVSGCGRGDGIERVTMAGSVTFRGQPVAEGQIRFIPKAGTAAPLTIEKVAAGRYATETSGGVPVGKHRVEILAWNPNEPAPSGPGAPPRRQLLPAKYNTQSQLEITLEPGQGQLNKDFDLTP